MTQAKRSLFAFVVLLLLPCAVLGQERDVNFPCADDVPEDALLQAGFLPADSSFAYPKDEVAKVLADQSREVQQFISAAQKGSFDTQQKLSPFMGYYDDVCPEYRFLLPYMWWFFMDFNAEKCFALHPVYFVWCQTNYCRTHSNFWFHWWYRCELEWRPQYFWAVCIDNNFRWSIRYVWKTLPVCCDCRRYRFFREDQCVIKGEQTKG